MHPYEAAYHFRVRHVGDHVKVKTGSLYHAFEQLQRKGFIEPAEVEREGRRPERTVYRVTEAGRAAADDAVARMVSEPVNEYTDFEAGLVSITHLGKEELLRCFRERAIQLRARAARGRCVLDANIARGVPRVFMLEVDQEIDRCTAQATWCDRIAAEIESGAIEWPDMQAEEIEHLAQFVEAPAGLPVTSSNGAKP